MRSFSTAKATHIFSTKNIGKSEKLTSENLTKCLLVLKNRDLIADAFEDAKTNRLLDYDKVQHIFAFA